ncbi:MAG: PP2C family protein-serine/threonine phosphatase [Desulfatibacillaceae bacterium]
MSRWLVFDLKNRMLIATLLANALCNRVVATFLFRGFMQVPRAEQAFAPRISWALDVGVALVLVIAILAYEKPIRRYIDARYRKEEIPPGLDQTAKRRLLNEPFFLVAFCFFLWVAASVVYTALARKLMGDHFTAATLFMAGLDTAPIAATLVFFVAEHVVGRHLGPYFFPAGGASRVPGARRIRIRARLVALLFAVNLIPFLSMIQVLHGTHLHQHGEWDVEVLRWTLVRNSVAFMAIGAFLTFFVAENLTRPFSRIIRVLRAARKGRFDRRVALATNDELGYTGDVVNEMMRGLAEREDLVKSMALAREVQQNLLPARAPDVEGLDMAGASHYCDQTGGDYLDYLDLGETGWKNVAVVVGDVSDHGIPSALVMIGARAIIRHHVCHTQDIREIVCDANEHLYQDLEASGRFMTLFFLSVYPGERRIQWIRAGHEPAMLYDPATDHFEELGGPGIALGAAMDCRVDVMERAGIESGQVLVLATDGLWEVRNPEGRMLGRDAMRDIIRRHASDGARGLVDALLGAARAHQREAEMEDDLTLAVIRFL